MNDYFAGRSTGGARVIYQPQGIGQKVCSTEPLPRLIIEIAASRPVDLREHWQRLEGSDHRGGGSVGGRRRQGRSPSRGQR